MLVSEPRRLTKGHSFTNKDQKLCQVRTRAGNAPWVSRTNTAWNLKKFNVINESNVHLKILDGSVELTDLSLILKFFSQLCNPSSLTHSVHISETPFFINLLDHAANKGPVFQITLID